MIETVACDQGCGAQLFRFANMSTCPDCCLLAARAAMPAAAKAAEWDEAMTWLDHHAPVLSPDRQLRARLEEFWRAFD